METIVVAGAGTMGAGIACVAAAAGFSVELVDPDADARARAQGRIAKDAQRSGRSDVLPLVQCFPAIPAATKAIAAIEAVPETLSLKRAVLRSFASVLGEGALLATNTSSLSVTDIAEGLPAPERVIGLHFFNPATAMQLVEIVRAQQTSDESAARARLLVERFGKTGVLAGDTPGFIVNRIARPYYLQAMRAYEAGVAPMEDLDRLACGAGFRMGPFELMDLIGLDVNLATSQSIYERTGLERLAPVEAQRQLVRAGRLGRKTKVGFYDYAAGTPAREDAPPQPAGKLDPMERIAIVGGGGVALELQEMLASAGARVDLWLNEDLLDGITLDTTIVIDVGDGSSDRSVLLAELDTLLSPETVFFADAYATDVEAAARRMNHPGRLVGYGILGSLREQLAIEVVDADATGDDALQLAQELFEAIGRSVVLVSNRAGLFLGRMIGSIVNEAIALVEEGAASAEDIDLAMRLGTNYPQGPIAWGREIGGDRIVRILQRVAGAEGSAFAPHRALWVLDAQELADAGA